MALVYHAHQTNKVSIKLKNEKQDCFSIDEKGKKQCF